MNKSVSKGDAHAVIIICLVSALVCALGIAFYQNFVLKKETSVQPASTQAVGHTNTQTSVNEQKPKLITGQVSVTSGAKVTFSYPEEWKAVQPAVGNVTTAPSRSSMSITSPTGTYQVDYAASEPDMAYGAECSPSDAPIFTKTSYQQLDKLPAASYVEYSAKQGESQTDFSGLNVTTSAKQYAVGGLACGVAASGLVGVPDMDNKKLILSARIAKGVSDTANSEYLQAKAILLSTEFAK